jgi:ATP-dependent DNA ligase
MGVATIPLAQSKFTPSKLNFPVYASIKYDGMPIRIRIVDGKLHSIVSRQDKPVGSVGPLVAAFVSKLRELYLLPAGDLDIVGEVVQAADPFAPFRKTGGIIRRQEPQDGLMLMIFECSVNKPFASRLDYMNRTFTDVHPQVLVVEQQFCTTEDKLTDFWECTEALNPRIEGCVARSHDDGYSLSGRSWGYQKMLKKPMIDLFIVGVEEAVDKYGDLKGMAGGLLAMYNGKKIGIGPGKLSHAERTELWQEWKQWQGAIASGYKDTQWQRMAQIQHKGDETYDALREPTFQMWRDDKETPDA